MEFELTCPEHARSDKQKGAGADKQERCRNRRTTRREGRRQEARGWFSGPEMGKPKWVS